EESEDERDAADDALLELAEPESERRQRDRLGRPERGGARPAELEVDRERERRERDELRRLDEREVRSGPALPDADEEREPAVQRPDPEDGGHERVALVRLQHVAEEERRETRAERRERGVPGPTGRAATERDDDEPAEVDREEGRDPKERRRDRPS